MPTWDTMPATADQSPLAEPARPQRARQEPDRFGFAAAALAALLIDKYIDGAADASSGGLSPLLEYALFPCVSSHLVLFALAAPLQKLRNGVRLALAMRQRVYSTEAAWRMHDPVVSNPDQVGLLCAVLSSVLGVDGVLPHQSFIESGGTSITAVQAAYRLRPAGRPAAASQRGGGGAGEQAAGGLGGSVRKEEEEVYEGVAAQFDGQA